MTGHFFHPAKPPPSTKDSTFPSFLRLHESGQKIDGGFVGVPFQPKVRFSIQKTCCLLFGKYVCGFWFDI